MILLVLCASLDAEWFHGPSLASSISLAADGDFKLKIVQRGAVPPLIDMLGNSDTQLREMAAFALGRLAQNPDNQVRACVRVCICVLYIWWWWW